MYLCESRSYFLPLVCFFSSNWKCSIPKNWIVYIKNQHLHIATWMIIIVILNAIATGCLVAWASRFANLQRFSSFRTKYEPHWKWSLCERRKQHKQQRIENTVEKKTLRMCKENIYIWKGTNKDELTQQNSQCTQTISSSTTTVVAKMWGRKITWR